MRQGAIRVFSRRDADRRMISEDTPEQAVRTTGCAIWKTFHPLAIEGSATAFFRFV
jgi:hypothetical protein